MRSSLALLVACACFAQQPAQKKDSPQTVKSFLTWLARVSGLSATSSSLRGDEVERQGDVWSEPVARGARQRLTFEGDYSWPVFSPDDRGVIALRGRDLWSVPSNGGNPVKLAHTLTGITGLVGSGPEGIVVFTDKQIGTFVPGSGVFTPFVPVSQDDTGEIDRLRAPIRSYNGGQLTVSEKQNSIVVVKSGAGPREIAPENAAVWQPSVSHDLKSVVYIRSDNAAR